jgi:outer membrane protein assembly factor BamB
VHARHFILAVVGLGFVLSPAAADWPQWRGPNRDARVAGFEAPKMWPKELTQKWKVTVGDGVATPALVGDRLYVFSREGDKEVTRALEAVSGKEIWKDEYAAEPATGAARGFPGPRSSPAVADGKVVTLGVRGVLSCLDAAAGKVLWRKDDFKSWPQFYTSCSPLIADRLVIVQLGGERAGGIVAYNLETGDEKWKWTDDGTAYSSPTLLMVDGVKAVAAMTSRQIVGIGLADGKLLWKTAFGPPERKGGFGKGPPAKGGPKGKGGGGRGGGRSYNAATPVVEGSTLVYSASGRGTKAVKVEKSDAGLAAKEIWTNPETDVQYNSPVVKDGRVFGITDSNELFCLKADGKTAWTAPIKGRGGYGSVVDVGPVLLALTPAAELVVFEPAEGGFKDLATYKVGVSDTYAYPVVAGNRIFIKDKDSVILWTVQ